MKKYLSIFIYNKLETILRKNFKKLFKLRNLIKLLNITLILIKYIIYYMIFN